MASDKISELGKIKCKVEDHSGQKREVCRRATLQGNGIRYVITSNKMIGEPATPKEIASIQNARSDKSIEMDLNIQAGKVISKSSPETKNWLKTPNMLDIEGIDTIDAPLRATAVKKGTPRTEKESDGMAELEKELPKDTKKAKRRGRPPKEKKVEVVKPEQKKKIGRPRKDKTAEKLAKEVKPKEEKIGLKSEYSDGRSRKHCKLHSMPKDKKGEAIYWCIDDKGEFHSIQKVDINGKEIGSASKTLNSQAFRVFNKNEDYSYQQLMELEEYYKKNGIMVKIGKYPTGEPKWAFAKGKEHYITLPSKKVNDPIDYKKLGSIESVDLMKSVPKSLSATPMKGKRGRPRKTEIKEETIKTETKIKTSKKEKKTGKKIECKKAIDENFDVCTDTDGNFHHLKDNKTGEEYDELVKSVFDKMMNGSNYTGKQRGFIWKLYEDGKIDKKNLLKLSKKSKKSDPINYIALGLTEEIKEVQKKDEPKMEVYCRKIKGNERCVKYDKNEFKTQKEFEIWLNKLYADETKNIFDTPLFDIDGNVLGNEENNRVLNNAILIYDNDDAGLTLTPEHQFRHDAKFVIPKVGQLPHKLVFLTLFGGEGEEGINNSEYDQLFKNYIEKPPVNPKLYDLLKADRKEMMDKKTYTDTRLMSEYFQQAVKDKKQLEEMKTFIKKAYDMPIGKISALIKLAGHKHSPTWKRELALTILGMRGVEISDKYFDDYEVVKSSTGDKEIARGIIPILQQFSEDGKKKTVKTTEVKVETVEKTEVNEEPVENQPAKEDLEMEVKQKKEAEFKAKQKSWEDHKKRKEKFSNFSDNKIVSGDELKSKMKIDKVGSDVYVQLPNANNFFGRADEMAMFFDQVKKKYTLFVDTPDLVSEKDTIKVNKEEFDKKVKDKKYCIEEKCIDEDVAWDLLSIMGEDAEVSVNANSWVSPEVKGKSPEKIIQAMTFKSGDDVVINLKKTDKKATA